MAGIIAARDDGLGVRGVAPRATVYGYNLLHIANRPEQSGTPWGATRRPRRFPTTVGGQRTCPDSVPPPGCGERAIDAGITNGYGGKGVFYAWAAGNGANGGDYSTPR